MSRRGVFFYYPKSNFEDNGSHKGTKASVLMVTLKQLQNVSLYKSSSTPATSREPANQETKRKEREAVLCVWKVSAGPHSLNFFSFFK